MKISEIADAETALGLWRLISDNTWAAINYQAQQEAKEKAAKAAKASKRKPRKSSPAAAKPIVLKPVKPSAAPKSGDEAAKPQKDKPQQEPSANASAQPAGGVGAAGSVGALPSSTNNSAPTSQSLLAADPDNPERLNLGQGKPAPTLL